jgi:DNA-binding MltR family transcriptional regulator
MARRKGPPPSISGLSASAQRFLDELEAQTDRGSALVAAAFLDDILEGTLRAHFLDAPKQVGELLDGPLSSFAARTKLAYCMGLIGRTIFDDLNVIREIRNDFAHHHEPISFEDQRARIMRLKVVSKFPPEHWRHAPRSARYRFQLDCVLLANGMLLLATDIDHVEEGEDY